MRVDHKHQTPKEMKVPWFQILKIRRNSMIIDPELLTPWRNRCFWIPNLKTAYGKSMSDSPIWSALAALGPAWWPWLIICMGLRHKKCPNTARTRTTCSPTNFFPPANFFLTGIFSPANFFSPTKFFFTGKLFGILGTYKWLSKYSKRLISHLLSPWTYNLVICGL